MLLLVLITIVVMATSEQTVCVAGVATAIGSGSTVTVAVIGLPTQPPALVGVMVKVTVCTTPVRLVSVPVMFPVPLAAIPVTLTVLSRVQA